MTQTLSASESRRYLAGGLTLGAVLAVLHVALQTVLTERIVLLVEIIYVISQYLAVPAAAGLIAAGLAIHTRGLGDARLRAARGRGYLWFALALGVVFAALYLATRSSLHQSSGLATTLLLAAGQFLAIPAAAGLVGAGLLVRAAASGQGVGGS